MEQKKAFPIRYIAGGFLLLASILLLLEDEYFIFYLSFFCLVGAALCFLPPNRMGLWIGGAAVIVLHFLAQQLRPGMLLVLLRDPPGGMEGDPLYFSTGFGAFVCFVYVCAITASCLDKKRPIAPNKTVTKLLIIVGWILFVGSCVFDPATYIIKHWESTIYYLPPMIAMVSAWVQYFGVHWLFFETIAWIWSAFRKKKEAKHD